MFWKSIPGRNERRESRAPFALSLAIASTFLSWSPAFGEAANQFIQAGRFQQQRIQAATREISDRLDALIEKFRSNRVGGKDLQTVLDLRSAVDRLATQDMQQIIVLLQDAEHTNNAGSTRESLAAVVAAQKEVVDQLRALLSNYRGSQIQEPVSTFRGATERLRQIRQQVAGALKQLGQASTIEQSRTRMPSHHAPPPTSNGNDSASVNALKGAAGTLADATAALDKLAAAVVSGASLRGTLQQAHQQLEAAAMHALDNDCAQAQANAIAAQQSLTQAQDALGQMTKTPQSSEADTSALSLNTVVDGQTGDAIEKSAPGDRGWTTWATGRLPGSKDHDTSFVAAHQGDRIVVMQPPPERVSTQYETLVEQYFKNLSDESVGTKSSTGGTP